MDHLCIVALIGLPAVGKTIMSKLLLEMEKLPFNCLHINYDNFIKFEATKEKSYKDQRIELLENLKEMIKFLKLQKNFPNEVLFNKKDNFRDFNTNKLLIICDDNHYYRSMRYKLYQIAREFQISFGQLYIQCNYNLSLERNNFRNPDQKIPPDVLHRMSVNMEEPQMNTFEFEKDTLSLTPLDINKDFIKSTIIPFVISLFERPLKLEIPLEEKKSNASHSSVHNLDITLRKEIGLFLNSSKVLNKKTVAKQLNEKKNFILREYQNRKSGYETLDECLKMFENFLEEF